MTLRSVWWVVLASVLVPAGTARAGEIKLGEEFSVDLYGFVLANAEYTNGRTRGAHLPVFALPENDDEVFDIFDFPHMSEGFRPHFDAACLPVFCAPMVRHPAFTAGCLTCTGQRLTLVVQR